MPRLPYNDEDTQPGSVRSIIGRLDRTSQGRACLVILAGPSIGERIPLAKDRITIGRQPSVDVPIEDTWISRRHAQISLQADGTSVLRDLGSKNETFCNSQRCHEKILKDGDLIQLGQSILKYVGPNSVEYIYLSELSERVQQDGLTGFLNKQAFFTYLERNLSRCRDLNEPLSMAMMDLDLFKKINDEWGHPAGDYVLKEFAILLKDGVRPTDLLARCGGEEFGLILPHTNLNEASFVGERLRNRIADHPFEYESQKMPVTISVGITERMENDEDIHPLIARADKALYEAKEKGRNQTCTFVETP